MPREMYVVYTVDKVNDNEDNTSERNKSITFIDPDSIDVHETGNTSCKTHSPPVFSPTATNTWGSFWSKKGDMLVFIWWYGDIHCNCADINNCF